MPQPSQAAKDFAAQDVRVIPVLPVGTFSKYDDIQITPDTLDAMLATFATDGGSKRPLPVDFNHSQVMGMGGNDDMCNAGIVVDLTIEDVQWPRYSGPCLFAHTIFCDEAKEAIATREYLYVSPVFATARKAEGVGEPRPQFMGFGLTNTPFLEMLPPIQESVQAFSIHAFSRPKNEGIMEEKKVEVVAAVKAPDNTEAFNRLTAENVTLMSRVESLSGEVSKLRDEAFAREVAQIIADGERTGRITPAIKPSVEAFTGAVKDVAQIQAFVSGLAIIAPQVPAKPTPDGNGPLGSGALTPILDGKAKEWNCSATEALSRIESDPALAALAGLPIVKG